MAGGDAVSGELQDIRDILLSQQLGIPSSGSPSSVSSDPGTISSSGARDKRSNVTVGAHTKSGLHGSNKLPRFLHQAVKNERTSPSSLGVKHHQSSNFISGPGVQIQLHLAPNPLPRDGRRRHSLERYVLYWVMTGRRDFCPSFTIK